MELFVKIVNLFSTFFMKGKVTISRYFETMTLTTQLRFYLFKVNDRYTKNTRAIYKMCLNVIDRTPEGRELHETGVFIVNFQ